MKFQTKHSPLLLLLLPSIATALVSRDAVPGSDADKDLAASIRDSDGSKSRPRLSAKDAPVDGKDGKPHLGPFVERDGTATDSAKNELPPLEGRPRDPTMVDGKKIPESNDSVMFDKNRERPLGSTGTEGGVSEKSAARKAHEGKTGEKPVVQPEAPKEQPPLPHSEEEKLGKDAATGGPRVKEKPTTPSDKDADFTGLGVCSPPPPPPSLGPRRPMADAWNCRSPKGSPTRAATRRPSRQPSTATAPSGPRPTRRPTRATASRSPCTRLSCP